MLSSPVYTEAHPRRSAVHAPSLHRACGWRIHPSSNLFRMNTCKSVSKQKTLSIFRINTYAKHSGWGQLLLTRHPLKGVCPERPSGVKDLSCHPMRIAVLPAPSFSGSESAAADESKDLSPEFGVQMLKRSGECGGSGSGERGGARGFQKFLCVFADVAVAEDGVAGNQEFGAGAHHVGDGIERDAAIHFDAKGQAARFADACEVFHLCQRAANKFLSAKSGIYGHHQDVMDDVQHIVQRMNRSRGINDHSRLAAVRGDQMQRAVQMDARLLMDRNPIGACLGKGRYVVVGVFDHQVAVQRNLRRLPKAGDHGRADRYVGDEVAVHDVHVEQSAAAFDGRLRIGAEPREVRRENRRRELYLPGQSGAPSLLREKRLYAERLELSQLL